MQQEIKQRKFKLSNVLQAAMKILCRQHFFEKFARQRGAGVDVAGHLLQHAPFPAIILHELRRQFDGIPFDAVDSRDAKLVNASQQVVQAVAGFVK